MINFGKKNVLININNSPFVPHKGHKVLSYIDMGSICDKQMLSLCEINYFTYFVRNFYVCFEC